MPKPFVSLPMVEAYLATETARLEFPAEIEALYDEQKEPDRRKAMLRGVAPLLVVYNVFLTADALLMPDTILLAANLHLILVTPIVLLAAFFYQMTPRPGIRELVAGAIPLLMLAQTMYIFVINRGPGADQYQYLAVLIVIYMNVILRLGYKFAVGSTLLLVLTYLAFLLPSASPFEVKFIGASLMLCAAYLSLLANRRMEQDERRDFLFRLREQLLREGAEQAANRDALTGLPNRRRLDEVVDAIWRSEEDRDAPVAAIMADIDHFKYFNDRYGHAAGDRCLKRIAGVLSAELRNERDLAVRLGGEEFLMLLPGATMSEAIRVAERVRHRVEALGIPHDQLGTNGVVTASFGVAGRIPSSHDFAELVGSADGALYAAKRRGRNLVWPPAALSAIAVQPLPTELPTGVGVAAPCPTPANRAADAAEQGDSRQA